jgi:alkylhydroperoxidase/carboxymuconolactone decarboxylase family protein YurZ
MDGDKSDTNLERSLKNFSREFGRVLDPVAFLNKKNPNLCATFLNLHELTLNDGLVSKKQKFMIHAAITAAQHDREATVMHITGAIKAGATQDELLEVAYTLIPAAGMPCFAVFIGALEQVINQTKQQR